MTRRLQSIDTPLFARPLDDTEDLAQMPYVGFTIWCAAFFFLFWGGIRAGVLMAVVPIVRFVVPVLKEAIERPRPSEMLVEVSNQPGDFSFPSGHAFTAILVYGLIFYLAGAHVPIRPMRYAIQAFCGWVIVVTALERVYVGHHWPSDVAGGLLRATVVLGVAVAADKRWSRLSDAVIASGSTSISVD